MTSSDAGLAAAGDWPSTNPPRLLEHRWGHALIGTLIHRAVHVLLEEDEHSPDGRQARAIARRVCPRPLASTHRQMVQQRVSAGLLCWSAGVDPRPRGWTWWGCEVMLGPRRVDTLWRTPDGLIVADELKSGRLTPAGRRQATSIAAAGRVIFGSGFSHVRLIALRSPSCLIEIHRPGRGHE